jgi:hypothetical protein
MISCWKARIRTESVSALVQKDLAVALGNNDIPRKDGLVGSHQNGQDNISSEDISLTYNRSRN